MKRILHTITVITFLTTAYAQAVYEPIESDIHNFLDRMNVKGIINLDTETKPYTRTYIAELLLELQDRQAELNNVESDELDWYLEEYYYEVTQLLSENSKSKIHNSELTDRWRAFSYTDSLFQLQISPVLGVGYNTIGDENGRFQFWGIRAFGSYGDNFAAQIHFTDNGLYNGIHKENNFLSPERGRETIGAQVTDGIEFSDVRGSISYDWGWGNLSLIKNYFSWGNGYFGNTILSAKAPSYPHLRLVLRPTDWFRFYYTHGWITSNVIDSLKSQFNYGIYSSDADFFVPKYYTANLFVFEPTESVELMIGNSAVYSGDRLRPEFFIPFMFFKYLDRDLGKGSVEDANGQLHFGVNYQPVEKLFLYGNILFDVIEINKTLEAEDPNNWFGFTMGSKVVNLPVDNLDFTLEYTRINPWVYDHKDTTTTYQHLDYSLGHWIGQNADLLTFQVDYKFIRSLSISAYYKRFRKGGEKDVVEAYDGPDGETEEFLYGPVRKENSFGINLKYNPFHETYLNLKYSYTDITDEHPTRTPEFQLGANHNFSISVSYGLK